MTPTEAARHKIETSRHDTPADADARLGAHAIIMNTHAQPGTGDQFSRDLAGAIRDICRKLRWVA